MHINIKKSFTELSFSSINICQIEFRGGPSNEAFENQEQSHSIWIIEVPGTRGILRPVKIISPHFGLKSKAVVPKLWLAVLSDHLIPPLLLVSSCYITSKGS